MMYPRFIQIMLKWLRQDWFPGRNPYPLSLMHKRSLPDAVAEPCTPLLERMYTAERWEVVKKLVNNYQLNKKDMEKNPAKKKEKVVADKGDEPDKEKEVEGRKRKGNYLLSQILKEAKRAMYQQKG
jgi:hypothetical protein